MGRVILMYTQGYPLRADTLLPPVQASRMSRLPMLLAATALLLITIIRPASAQTDATWIAGDGQWSTGSNWSGGVVPDTALFNAIIDGGNGVDSEVRVSDGGFLGAFVGSLAVDAGDKVAAHFRLGFLGMAEFVSCGSCLTPQHPKSIPVI